MSVGFWNLSFINNILNPDIQLIIAFLWAISAFYFFQGKSRIKSIYSMKYINYMNAILVGVLISMFSAFLFWNQSLIITLIAQRQIYSFVLLPAILYVQPTIDDIIKALKWITVGSITIWVITIFYPHIVVIDEETFELRQTIENTDIGFSTGGIGFILLYLYYKIQEYINKFSWNSFMIALVLVIFVFLRQNRSTIIGVVLIFIYSLIKMKSKFKLGIIFIISIFLITGLIYSTDIWKSLIDESQNNLNDPEYNRWVSLYYYLFDYSPNWFCYIFGNGFPSANSSFGQLMWKNFEKGIYASDLGMIGMWVDYGLIPLIAIYSVIFRTLKRKIFPLHLKFICFHILLIPTIFHFWSNPGISLIVIIIYFFAYYNEKSKTQNYDVGNYNSKL